MSGDLPAPGFNLTLELPSSQARFPHFSEPQVVGCYSLDSTRQFIDGPEYLRFCHRREGPVNFDLDDGCTEESIENSTIVATNNRSNENSQMKHLRRWINLHQDQFRNRRPAFVMRRGVMLKILNLPYDWKEDLILAAMIKNGTIYVRKILLYQTTAEWSQYHSNARHKRCSNWGQIFEHFLLTDEPSTPPDPKNPRKGECNLVFSARLNGNEILYAAESDGIWATKNSNNDYLNPKRSPEVLSQCQLIELKTCREFIGDEDFPVNFRRYALRKWWSQAFLGRVAEILIGFRDDAGVVKRLQVHPVHSLQSKAVDWSPSLCFNFLHQFLEQLKSLVKDESLAYVFHFDPKHQPSANVVNWNVTVENDSSKLLPDLV